MNNIQTSNYQKLLAIIKLNEGFNASAYQDSLGYLTIGYGKLIDKRLDGKLSEKICDLILQEELNDCYIELRGYAWFVMQDEIRQQVLMELCFNMGLPHFLKFNNMINCLIQKIIQALQPLY